MKKRVSKEKRGDLIMKCFWDAARNGLKPSFTATEIAHMIGLKPSHYVIGILNDLVECGDLKSTAVIHRKANGRLKDDVVKFVYYIDVVSPLEIELEKSGLQIKVNGRIV